MVTPQSPWKSLVRGRQNTRWADKPPLYIHVYNQENQALAKFRLGLAKSFHGHWPSVNSSAIFDAPTQCCGINYHCHVPPCVNHNGTYVTLTPSQPGWSIPQLFPLELHVISLIGRWRHQQGRHRGESAVYVWFDFNRSMLFFSRFSEYEMVQ